MEQRRDLAEVQRRGAEREREERERAQGAARPLTAGGASSLLVIEREPEAAVEREPDRAQDMGIQQPLEHEARERG